MAAVIADPIRLTSTQHADLMRFAFHQVCSQEDWKAPIDAFVPWDLASLYMQAIEFMTALRPSYFKEGNLCHLTCVGYRNGPAGE